VSAAVVPVALECGCNPPLGIYCETARLIVLAADRWEEEIDERVIADDDGDRTIELMELSSTASGLLALHLNGRG
jgi:hypothetical protein